MAVSYLPKEEKNWIDYKASCYDDLNIEIFKVPLKWWNCLARYVELVLAYFQETRVLATWVSKRQFMMALTFLILQVAYFSRVGIEWLWSQSYHDFIWIWNFSYCQHELIFYSAVIIRKFSKVEDKLEDIR